jgi:hypothetical protein
MERAKIIGRKRDMNGNVVGTYHDNSILNTRINVADFPYGHIMEYSAIAIAEAIFNNLNDDST